MQLIHLQHMYEILKENYGKSRRKKKNLICYCSKIKALLKLFNCMVSEINTMYNALYSALVILYYEKAQILPCVDLEIRKLSIVCRYKNLEFDTAVIYTSENGTLQRSLRNREIIG